MITWVACGANGRPDGGWRNVPFLARGRADLGAWLTRRGRPNEAAALLADARSTHDQLGALRWRRELDDQGAGVSVSGVWV